MSHPTGASSEPTPKNEAPTRRLFTTGMPSQIADYPDGPAKPDCGQAFFGPSLVVVLPKPLPVRPLTAFLRRTAEAPRLCDRDGPMRSCPRFPVTDLQAALVRMPVIGILRGCPPQYVDDMVTAAEDAGLTALEVTLDSREPFDAVRSLVENHPGMTVGAGTVRSVREVAQAVEAGARFIVSPHFDQDVVAAASAAGVVSVPGAATPTEVWRATSGGAAMVKLFPARELGGPAFVEAIRGPLGGPALVPTGGVDVSNAADFLEAGSTAIGVGGAVFPRTALESGNAAEVERRCRSLIAAIR